MMRQARRREKQSAMLRHRHQLLQAKPPGCRPGTMMKQQKQEEEEEGKRSRMWCTQRIKFQDDGGATFGHRSMKTSNKAATRIRTSKDRPKIEKTAEQTEVQKVTTAKESQNSK